jgi:secondary thiamine-phosphate synthase enzyme
MREKDWRMKVINKTFTVRTQGFCDLINITGHAALILADSGLGDGVVTLFVVGSTAALTTFEYEPGVVGDMSELYEKLVPMKKGYHHDATWGDANGFSHARAALQGPSLAIPFAEGRMLLGTWQQIVLCDFDNQGRNRKIAVNIIGE